MTISKLDALFMVNEIEKEGKKLKPHEKRFLESIKSLPYGSLTFKQGKFLMDIYERATGGGAYQGKQRF